MSESAVQRGYAPVIDEELEWQALRLSKIVHKKFELWAISRIVHRLDDTEIEWVTQQLVRDRERGRVALLDLYFPQFRLAVEIDELGHLDQIEADRLRQQRIIDDADVTFWRWQLANIRSLNDARREIDSLIDQLLALRRGQETAGTFVPFRFGSKYDVERWLVRGEITVEDDARFRRHIDVARLFGKHYKAHYSGMISLSDSLKIWFPKLYGNDAWHNVLLHDGMVLAQRSAAEAASSAEITMLPSGTGTGETRLVFAHHEDEFGKSYYRFVGAFTHVAQVGDRADFRRVGDAVSFDGRGASRIMQAGILS